MASKSNRLKLPQESVEVLLEPKYQSKANDRFKEKSKELEAFQSTKKSSSKLSLSHRSFK